MDAATPHPFFVYTAETLAWRLGTGRTRPPPPPDAAEAATVRTARILRCLAGREHIVLLGLGSGSLAATLAASLPAGIGLTVVSLDPDTARSLLQAGRLPWLSPAGPAQLLADASTQAACHLLWAVGPGPQHTLVTVNPEPAAAAETRALAQVRRLLTGSRPLPPPDPTLHAPTPALTLAVLARAEEPGLEAFFQAVRGLATRAVMLWDAPEVPPAARAGEVLGIPVRHLARPLAGDFAAQRNALLQACPPGWVLSLDPDERPGPGFAAALARIMAAEDVGGAYFPRLTLYPDATRAKVGHGLWPDWQLRLFRWNASAGPRYVRPLHERLEGLSGTVVLALDAPLLHHNRLLADADGVAGKLLAFSRLPGAVAHHLSADYPTLPLDFFHRLDGDGATGRFFALPKGA
jgi:hypothetical protein